MNKDIIEITGYRVEDTEPEVETSYSLQGDIIEKRRTKLEDVLKYDPLFVFLQGENIITEEVLNLEDNTSLTTQNVERMLQTPEFYDPIKGDYYVKDSTIRYWLTNDRVNFQNYVGVQRHGRKSWSFSLISYLRIKMIARMHYVLKKDLKEIEAKAFGLIETKKENVLINSDNILQIVEKGILNETTEIPLIRNALKAYIEHTNKTQEKFLQTIELQQQTIEELKTKIDQSVTQQQLETIRSELPTATDIQAVKEELIHYKKIDEKMDIIQKRMELRKMALKQWEVLGFFKRLRTDKDSFIEEYVETHINLYKGKE